MSASVRCESPAAMRLRRRGPDDKSRTETKSNSQSVLQQAWNRCQSISSKSSGHAKPYCSRTISTSSWRTLEHVTCPWPVRLWNSQLKFCVAQRSNQLAMTRYKGYWEFRSLIAESIILLSVIQLEKTTSLAGSVTALAFSKQQWAWMDQRKITVSLWMVFSILTIKVISSNINQKKRTKVTTFTN